MCLRLVINTFMKGFLSRDVFNQIEIFIDDRFGPILFIVIQPDYNKLCMRFF
jgi:hypothetical protein